MVNILKEFDNKIEILTHAYQPIVNIHNGIVMGVESLLRNYKEAGFESINEIFDYAFIENRLFNVEIKLRKKAINKLINSGVNLGKDLILFYNLDNRVVASQDYEFGKTLDILYEFGWGTDKICFEISERHYLDSSDFISRVISHYKRQGFKIAIDDFGVKFSGLEYIYHFEPDFVKIDRFFINEINKNAKKRLFVEHIVSLCSKLGIKLIAEGIETEEEFKECRDMGFHFVQGYFIEKPQIDIKGIKKEYEFIKEIKLTRIKNDKQLILEHIKFLEPLRITDSPIQCFSLFKDSNINLIPVINEDYEPVGVITEKSLRDYAYTPYGRDLLSNRSQSNLITEIMVKVPILPVNSKIEHIIENFIQKSNEIEDHNIQPVIITNENGRYIGYLDAHTLLNMVHKINLVKAANQNPLTKLPGNNLIREFIMESFNSNDPVLFIYFDIDKFKIFNDLFGFRLGDRIILLLADLLQKSFSDGYSFVGHVGGDDFFVGYKLDGVSFEKIYRRCKAIQNNFNESCRIFYPKDILDQGYVIAKDREGVEKRFELVSVSFAILQLHPDKSKPSEEKISKIIALLKKQAKTFEGSSIATFFNPLEN